MVAKGNALYALKLWRYFEKVMKSMDYIKKIKEKGPRGIIKWCKKKIQKRGKEYNLLLLTNRDSDNVGDQVIEVCAISLLSAVMKNLGLNNFKITSRAAGMITEKYLTSRAPELLNSAENSISKADLVVFGGAPLFNWHHQNFYERTTITLELAEQYAKPVIFSSIGIEGYAENNKRCQRLKSALEFDCVKQITTRDDFESLKKFVENTNVLIDKVADPAVFTKQIFKKYILGSAQNKGEKKKIGIFVLRAGGFVDNDINFTGEDEAILWKKFVAEIENKGYDYEFLTSGHCCDEAFLDQLIRKQGIDKRKCRFNINLPETLVERIASYDAIVSCRLHPSIIAFSLGIPAIGIIWNSKVKYFYESIGYEDRVISTHDISSEKLLGKLEQAMEQGVNSEEEYLMSVYRTLLNGVQRSLKNEKDIRPYTYTELLKVLPDFEGTSKEEEMQKLERKFRRTYDTYNAVRDKYIKLKESCKK